MATLDHKACTKCAEKKPLNLFAIRRNRGGGYTSACKACLLVYNKSYQDSNKARTYGYTKKWRAKNSERVRVVHLAHSRSEKAKETARRWVDRNREHVRMQNRIRKAMRRGMRTRVTKERIDQLLVLQNYCCAVCRCDIRNAFPHRSHFLLFRKAGIAINTTCNLLCESCNCSKGAMRSVEFMQRRGFLI